MVQGEVLTWEGINQLRGGPISCPQKLGKLISYFDKVPGLPQAQNNKSQGTEISLSLSVTHTCPMHLCILSPLPCSPSSCMADGCADSKHRLQARIWILQHSNGLQPRIQAKLAGWRERLDWTKLQYDTRSLDTGLCFVLTEDMVGLFHCWDTQRRDTGAATHSNKSCYPTTSHVQILEILFSGCHEIVHFHWQQQENKGK